jgi:hypothetical protein
MKAVVASKAGLGAVDSPPHSSCCRRLAYFNHISPASVNYISAMGFSSSFYEQGSVACQWCACEDEAERDEREADKCVPLTTSTRRNATS